MARSTEGMIVKMMGELLKATDKETGLSKDLINTIEQVYSVHKNELLMLKLNHESDLETIEKSHHSIRSELEKLHADRIRGLKVSRDARISTLHTVSEQRAKILIEKRNKEAKQAVLKESVGDTFALVLGGGLVLIISISIGGALHSSSLFFLSFVSGAAIVKVAAPIGRKYYYKIYDFLVKNCFINWTKRDILTSELFRLPDLLQPLDSIQAAVEMIKIQTEAEHSAFLLSAKQSLKSSESLKDKQKISSESKVNTEKKESKDSLPEKPSSQTVWKPKQFSSAIKNHDQLLEYLQAVNKKEQEGNKAVILNILTKITSLLQSEKTELETVLQQERQRVETAFLERLRMEAQNFVEKEGYIIRLNLQEEQIVRDLITEKEAHIHSLVSREETREKERTMRSRVGDSTGLLSVFIVYVVGGATAGATFSVDLVKTVAASAGAFLEYGTKLGLSCFDCFGRRKKSEKRSFNRGVDLEPIQIHIEPTVERKEKDKIEFVQHTPFVAFSSHASHITNISDRDTATASKASVPSIPGYHPGMPHKPKKSYG